MSDHFDKGIRQIENKQLRNAIKSFTEAIEAGENVLAAYLHRSSCYFQLKEYENVVKDLTDAIDIEPTYEQFYYNRAAAYVNLFKYTEALEDYNIAISLNPKYVNAHYNKASVHMKLEQHEQAVFSFMKASDLGHEDAKIVLKHFEQRGKEINEGKAAGETPTKAEA